MSDRNDRIVAVGAGRLPNCGADERSSTRGKGGDARARRPPLPHRARQGLQRPLPLWEYLDTCWYPLIRDLDPEAAYWAALSSYAESIKCGVTTVNDMYRQLAVAGRAAVDIGIRAVLSNDVAPDEHDLDTLRGQQVGLRGRSTAPATAGSRSTSGSSGCRWPHRSCCGTPGSWPTTSVRHPRPPQRVADRGRGQRGRFGRRPTEIAYEAGMLGRNCIAAHCVWLSDTEIALMRRPIRRSPTTRAQCQARQRHRELPEMLAAGLNVGLGHDAAECNNSRTCSR